VDRWEIRRVVKGAADADTRSGPQVVLRRQVQGPSLLAVAASRIDSSWSAMCLSIRALGSLDPRIRNRICFAIAATTLNLAIVVTYGTLLLFVVSIFANVLGL
jgi:hypothetical protein